MLRCEDLRALEATTMPIGLVVGPTTRLSALSPTGSSVSSMAASLIASRTARISPGGPLSNSRLDNLRLWDVYRNPVTELAGTEAQLEQEPLDDADAAERLPAEIEPAILRKYFSLTRADQDEVERCRGPANKLGYVMWTFRGRVLKSTVGV
jgi:hypothetical protein